MSNKLKEKVIVEASKTKRYLAELIDRILLLVFFLTTVLTMMLMKITDLADKLSVPDGEFFLITLIAYFIIWLFLILKDRSYGKLIFGLKVVNMAGGKANFETIYRRINFKQKMYFNILFEDKYYHDELSYTKVIDLRKSKKLGFRDEQVVVYDEWSIK